MTEKQEERLVASWEAIAKGLGDLNDIARTAISKQWPDPRQPREAIITRIPTPEDKKKVESGNTDGPLEDWLGEFDPEEEIGPREKAFLDSQRTAGQAKLTARPKAPSKAKG